MNTSERIPPLLSPYIRLPSEETLALVSGTVSTTANWVLLRYLYAVLGGNAQATGAPVDDVGVVLVSWMRDLAFWKTEARRAMGIDLGRSQQQGRFAFVDGLSSLFTPVVETVSKHTSNSAPISRDSTSTRTPLPTRGPASPRAPHLPISRAHPHAPLSNTSSQTSSTHTLTSSSLSSIETTTTNAISSLKTQRVLLILDTPSVILHTTNPPITASNLTASLLMLRSHSQIFSTIIVLPADTPFLAPAGDAALAHLHSHRLDSGSTSALEPLAIDNAAFMVSVTHMAKWVLSLRMLGTGWAEDVSGVVRVTRGGCADEENEGGAAEEVKEGEWLYHVGGDASVKVWGRGESGR